MNHDNPPLPGGSAGAPERGTGPAAGAEPADASTRGLATEVKEGARQAVQETKEALREEARHLAASTRTEVRSLTAHRAEDAALRLETVARALRVLADDPRLGGRTARAAAGIERTADALRRQDLAGLARDAERLARRHPELFVGGLALAGIALGRFLKASRRREEEWDAAIEPSGDFYPSSNVYPSDAGRPVGPSGAGGEP